MKGGDDNKIEVYFRNFNKAKVSLKYLSELTNINLTVFIAKKLSIKADIK